jgi:hypothetical protein
MQTYTWSKELAQHFYSLNNTPLIPRPFIEVYAKIFSLLFKIIYMYVLVLTLFYGLMSISVGLAIKVFKLKCSHHI